MFSEGHGTFELRPISLTYIRYAAQDVEDLVEIKEKMLEEGTKLLKSKKVAVAVSECLGRCYAEQGCKAVSLRDREKGLSK